MVSPWAVTFSLVVVVLAAIYKFITHKQSYFEKLGIPHLKPYFLIGNQDGVVFKKRSFLHHVRWLYEQLPEAKYHGFYDFITPTIIIKDPELIKEVTVKHFDNFTDHSAFVLDDLDPLFSKNLFGLRGQKWREYRAMLSPSFTSTKLKGMFNLINKCALDLKEFLLLNNKGSEDTDTKDLFSRYTNDVIASAAFGMTVNSLRERDNEFFKFGKVTTAFDYVKTLKMFLTKSFPWLARIFRLRIIDTKISTFFTSIIDNNVKTREKQGISRPDMIQLMLQANADSKNGTKMDLIDMTAQAFIFFFAGFETTSTAMCFAAHLLAAHPEIQKKLAQGVKERYGAINNESTGYETLRDFHYLDAVVSETLRMYPPAQAVDRVCTKRFELPPALPGGKPVVVEPGTILWIPIAGMHYNKEFHDEPEKFNPNRFLDSNGNIKWKITDSTTFMPFGVGPRICIAHRFAILEIKLVLTHLLALCEVLPSEKTPSPLHLSKKSFQMIPDNGFWLHLKPREGQKALNGAA